MKTFVMTVVMASLLAACSGMGGMGRRDSGSGASSSGGMSGTSGTGDTSGSSSQRRSGSGTNPQSDEYGGPAK